MAGRGNRGKGEMLTGIPSLDQSVLEEKGPAVKDGEIIHNGPLEVIVDRYDDDTGMPVVAGHTLSIPQWYCFCMWAECGWPTSKLTGKLRDAGHQATKGTIDNWRIEEWWKKLAAAYTGHGQRALFEGMTRRVPGMLTAIDGVLSGKPELQKSGNAIVQLIKGFAEMGGDPLISRGAKVNIDNRTQTINLGNVTTEMIDGMSATELARLCRPNDGPIAKKRHK